MSKKFNPSSFSSEVHQGKELLKGKKNVKTSFLMCKKKPTNRESFTCPSKIYLLVFISSGVLAAVHSVALVSAYKQNSF